MKVSVVIPVYNQEELVIKALDSIPVKEDIEIVVIDDGSTDDTWNSLLQYTINHRSCRNIVLLYNLQNMGVGYTVNRGLKVATGDYIVLLGSDDYLITDTFETVINEELDGTDLVYFNLEINDGTIFDVTEDTKYSYCGSVKFMRNDFIHNIDVENRRHSEDWYFFNELQKHNPTEKFTRQVVKHYNFPREGSLSFNVREGIED